LEKRDLWWRVRALQELGWRDKLRETLVAHRETINQSADLLLKIELARAEGDFESYANARKALARTERSERHKAPSNKRLQRTTSRRTN